MHFISFHSAINSSNLQKIVARQKGEWLVADKGRLRLIKGSWQKTWFIVHNLITFGKQKQNLIQSIEKTFLDVIHAAQNDPNFPLQSDHPLYLNRQGSIKIVRNALKRLKSSLYSPQTLQVVKELASCPELIEARAAMKKGILPQRLDEGISGSYILLDRSQKQLGIFKPREQEAGSTGNPKGFAGCKGLFGVLPGSSYLREKVAYALDKHDHFCGVPKTKVTSLDSRLFTKSGSSNQLTGSFQKWVANAHHAYDDYQILPRFLSSAQGDKIAATEIHKIAILDIRTLNCDRHLHNFLVDSEWNVHPIDHGYILPGSAASIRFDWINFAQAKQPFSKETLEYIERLNPAADAALIKRKIPNISENTLKMMEISTLLLKIAACKGLTAYQIADLMMRRSHEGLLSLLNFFVPVPSQTPSYFETHIWQQLKDNPSVNKEAFLSVVIDHYISQ